MQDFIHTEHMLIKSPMEKDNVRMLIQHGPDLLRPA